MIRGAQTFLLGVGSVTLALSMPAPGYAQASPSASVPSSPPLGDTLRFLSNDCKPQPRRAVRRPMVVARRAPPALVARGAPPALFVPVVGPYGFGYIEVPAYPSPVYRVPLAPAYPYRPVFVPPYRYGVPVY